MPRKKTVSRTTRKSPSKNVRSGRPSRLVKGKTGASKGATTKRR